MWQVPEFGLTEVQMDQSMDLELIGQGKKESSLRKF